MVDCSTKKWARKGSSNCAPRAAHTHPSTLPSPAHTHHTHLLHFVAIRQLLLQHWRGCFGLIREYLILDKLIYIHRERERERGGRERASEKRGRGSYLVHSSIHKTKWQSGFACLRHSRRKSSNYTHIQRGVCVCVGLVCRCVLVLLLLSCAIFRHMYLGKRTSRSDPICCTWGLQSVRRLLPFASPYCCCCHKI